MIATLHVEQGSDGFAGLGALLLVGVTLIARGGLPTWATSGTASSTAMLGGILAIDMVLTGTLGGGASARRGLIPSRVRGRVVTSGQPVLGFPRSAGRPASSIARCAAVLRPACFTNCRDEVCLAHLSGPFDAQLVGNRTKLWQEHGRQRSGGLSGIGGLCHGCPFECE